MIRKLITAEEGVCFAWSYLIKYRCIFVICFVFRLHQMWISMMIEQKQKLELLAERVYVDTFLHYFWLIYIWLWQLKNLLTNSCFWYFQFFPSSSEDEEP